MTPTMHMHEWDITGSPPYDFSHTKIDYVRVCRTCGTKMTMRMRFHQKKDRWLSGPWKFASGQSCFVIPGEQ